MSGLIVACSRPGTDLPFSAGDVRTVAARLAPDHIAPRAPLVVEEQGLLVAVVNPIPDLPVTPGAVCLGALVGSGGGWGTTGPQRPDGSYAVCRWDSGPLELVTDNLASRAIWYVLDGDVFLASTSQRALVALLGDFKLSSGAVAWLASSGTLGPDGGWDTRLRMMPPAAVLTLDRRAWTTRCAAESLDPHPEALPDKVHLQRWRDAILETCEELEVALDTWLLPLSGGLDSRVLLAALIAGGRRPRCVTWGLRRSLDDPENDAVVARRLAEHYRLDHFFLATDMDDTPAGVVIDRFLVAGEGRTDQIAGYLDGLRVWQTLYEDGVSGVIRGDEPDWGDTGVPTDADVTRRDEGGAVVSDYPQGHLIRHLGLAPQPLPGWMLKTDEESLGRYASRLWDRHGFQVEMAPLNDVKAAYVEIVNPFLADRVMKVARALPGNLYSQRRGFKAVAAGLSPPIPVAKRSAIVGSSRLLSSSTAVIDEITAGLSSPEAERICERQGLDRVISALRTPGAARVEPRVLGAVRAVVPRRVKAALKPRPPLTLSSFRLAFRLHLAIRMATMLHADAAALRDGASASPTTRRTSPSP